MTNEDKKEKRLREARERYKAVSEKISKFKKTKRLNPLIEQAMANADKIRKSLRLK